MSFPNYPTQMMEGDKDVKRNSKFRSNLPVPKNTNISKFGYQEIKPLELPKIDQSWPISAIHVGERVCVSQTKCGVLRYYGNTSFAAGWWCGIELDEPVGKNNGVIDGVTYFECQPNHGIFAPPSKVRLLRDAKITSGDGDVPKEKPKCYLPLLRKVNNYSYTIESEKEILNETFTKSPERVMNETFDKITSDVIEEVNKTKLINKDDDGESFDLDESLGILTPSQMVDSLFGDSQLMKTPSFEDLMDEVVEDVHFEEYEEKSEHPPATSTPVVKDTPDIWKIKTPKLNSNESYFNITQPINTPGELIVKMVSPITTHFESTKKLNLVADHLSKDVIRESLRQVGNEISQMPTEILMNKMGPNFCEVMEKKDRPLSSLTMSVTSIDTGYQGDAECDVQSNGPSAINTPVEDQKKIFGVDEKDFLLMISAGGDAHHFLRHPRTDVGSDSDFCSDMGTSWTESEVENDEKNRGRAARVIDGTLYYNDANDEKNVKIVIPTGVEDVEEFRGVKSSSDSSTLDETLTEKLAEETQVVEETSPFVGPPAPPDVLDGMKEEETASGPDKAKKASRNRKRNDVETPTKKFKSPKKNVMSKIKAMIEATSCKTNGDGGGEQGDIKEEKKMSRATKKNSRWDAVMSKIAAGQAEEKAKGKVKRPVKSRVDTNLSSSKSPLNGTSRLVKRDSTLSEHSENGGGDTIRSTRSSDLSQRNARTPRISTAERPLSPSQLSDISTMSAASHLSSLSQTSNRPSTSLKKNRKGARALSANEKESILVRQKSTGVKNNRQNVLNAINKPPGGGLGAKKAQTTLTNGCSSRTTLSSTKAKVTSKTTLPNKSTNATGVGSGGGIHSRLAATSKDSLPPQRLKKSVPARSQLAPKAVCIGGADSTSMMSFMRRDKERRRSNSLQFAKSIGDMDSVESTPKQTPAPSLADLSRDEPKNRSKRWRSGSFARLFRLCGSNMAKAEQTRIRNLKSAPVVKSGHHQPDLLNLSSVTTTQSESEKEITRLESICEAHAKEISRLKCLLEQRTMGFEAFTVFAKYMIEDLDAFAHPAMMKEMHYMRCSLDVCKAKLDQVILEKENLQAKSAELIISHQAELDKLKQGHENEIIETRKLFTAQYENEIKNLTEDFDEARKKLIEKHDAEIADVKEENEGLFKEKLNGQLSELRLQHSLQINTIQTEYDLKLEELTKEYNCVNYSLEQQLQALNSKCNNLQRQKEEYEEALLKDNNHKLQIAAAKIVELQKEVDSLKSVVELRNNELHEMRAMSDKVKRLEEELYFSEEKVKSLSARNEDLQEQVDIKNNKEKQLSCEQEQLREWFERESQMNIRLSMEKEQLEWKLQQSMEAPALGALFDLSPSRSPNHCMTTSTPVYIGASDGDMQKDCSYKRSLPFSSIKAIPSHSSPKIDRSRHHRQRFSVSDKTNLTNERDESPGTRSRRTQSLSWTVGIELDENDLKLTQKEMNGADEELDVSITEEECKANGATGTNESKAIDETETSESKTNAETEIIKTDVIASQQVVIKSKLERRNSTAADARVPSLITVHDTSRPKRERRNSLGNLKYNDDFPQINKTHRSLSTPYDNQVKKRSPRSSPIKTKSPIKQKMDNSELLVRETVSDSIEAAIEEMQIELDEKIHKISQDEEVIKECNEDVIKIIDESQENPNQRSIDSEDFSGPLTISLKSDDKISSCESSPIPEPSNELNDQSQSSESENSSPSPHHFRSEMENRSVCIYGMSPRMSGGESMVMDEVPKSNLPEHEMIANDLLLRRSFPEFFTTQDVNGRDSSIEDNMQDTPESGSLSILPTHSTNIDLSWSEGEDEIPSESEV